MSRGGFSSSFQLSADASRRSSKWRDRQSWSMRWGAAEREGEHIRAWRMGDREVCLLKRQSTVCKG